MTDATVTCRTLACPSRGEPIDLSVSYLDDDGNEQFVSSVVCGACGKEITDVDPPLPGTDPEPEPRESEQP